jgi:hypothetical protein
MAAPAHKVAIPLTAEQRAILHKLVHTGTHAAPADRSTSSRAYPDWRPTTPATGGRSVAKRPRPRRLLAHRRGGSPGWRCGRPFSPRVLVHLVGLVLRDVLA